MKLLLVASLLFMPSPAMAHNSKVFEECNRYEIKEKYHEGYYDSHGRYVSGYVTNKRVKVPCLTSRVSNHYHHQSRPTTTYVNHNPTPKCTGEATLGGLLGGGLAASLSKKDAYAWAIPLGAVVGMGIGNSGCQ